LTGRRKAGAHKDRVTLIITTPAPVFNSRGRKSGKKRRRFSAKRKRKLYLVVKGTPDIKKENESLAMFHVKQGRGGKMFHVKHKKEGAEYVPLLLLFCLVMPLAVGGFGW
jgi:hypothetical protein